MTVQIRQEDKKGRHGCAQSMKIFWSHLMSHILSHRRLPWKLLRRRPNLLRFQCGIAKSIAIQLAELPASVFMAGKARCPNASEASGGALIV